MRTLNGAVVLIAGANGGLGREFVSQAIERGAAKVKATARTPRDWDYQRVVSLVLNVIGRASVRAATAKATDVTMLINNAGASSDGSMLDDALPLGTCSTPTSGVGWRSRTRSCPLSSRIMEPS